MPAGTSTSAPSGEGGGSLWWEGSVEMGRPIYGWAWEAAAAYAPSQTRPKQLNTVAGTDPRSTIRIGENEK